MPEKKDNLRPFQSGKDDRRNLTGRPKGSLNSKTIIEKWLKVKGKFTNPITGEEVRITQLDAITLAQLGKALNGDTQAYNALIDRKEGKPMQKQEVTQRTIIVEVQDEEEPE